MVTRLSGGLTPANGADPRTFPAIWNSAAVDIETAEADIDVLQASVTANGTAITALQGSAVALGSAVDVIEAWNLDDLNDVTIGTAIADGQVLAYSTAVSGWVNEDAVGGGGNILQVVFFETSTTTTTTSATPVATNLVASITPSSTSSKVLVQVSAGRLFSTTTGGRAQLRLFRGGVSDTGLGLSAIHSSTFTAVGGGTLEATGSIVFLDSPNTTSSQTYTVGISTSSAGNSVSVASQQSMILMEVAG